MNATMTASDLLAEMSERAMSAERFPEVVRYCALASIVADAFSALPAGVIVGLLETLTKDEKCQPRANAALALCAGMKVAPLPVDTFVFFGAGLWIIAARAVLDAVKREPDNATRTAMLIEVADGLLQDSSAMLVGFVNAPPVLAVQDVVLRVVSAEVAGETPPADEHWQKAVRARRLALANAIDGFVTACEEAPGCGASQVVFFERIAPAFDDLIEVERLEATPEIAVERDGFQAMSHASRRVVARKYRSLAGE